MVVLSHKICIAMQWQCKGKNYHPQTYIESVNTPTQKNDNAAC